jgi:hypothetical protein
MHRAILRAAPRAITRSVVAGVVLMTACDGSAPDRTTATAAGTPAAVTAGLARYTTVPLVADTTALTPAERRMLPLLIAAANEMNDIYWDQAYGSRDSLLGVIGDSATRRFAEINYGPWDRLDEDRPFVAGVGPKPDGANLYPHDITRPEFDAAVAAGPAAHADSLKSLYTLVRRDSAGALVAVPYHVAYERQLTRAASLLREAAALAEQPGLRRYLTLRADALLSDEFRASDLAWMEMDDNTLDIVIGPIETYEDQLYGYKAANEGYVLIKDREWSQRLAHYIALLPGLQRGLPVPEELRRETPGTGSQLNAYDAVFYAGQANAGAKTIAINLPNDEQVQLSKGTRRLQLKNAMRAKFDRILVPIADELIVPEQQKNITFDAFFENTMFHEVAHGLGIKNTINGRGTVRTALKELASGLEEEKADVLGLYMVTQLTTQGELPAAELLDNYVTFLAGLFRSVRFGASDAHGIANMATFNFFQDEGAFTRDSTTGKYSVNIERMQRAVNDLSARILQLQGNGDHAGVGEFMRTLGVVRPELRVELDSLASKGIPVDVIFDQATPVDTTGRR